MTTPLTCLFIAMLLPYLARIPAATAMGRLEGGYDNNNPRGQQEILEGAGKRSVAAQNNSFEALIVFTAALFIASQREVNSTRLDQLCIAFIGARVLFIFFYLSDKATLRSSSWILGFACCVWIAVLQGW
jgi:uncharacterized MAPEG superfamily protein